MLAAALRDGTAHRRTTFEVFARRLPEGRRYGIVAGTGRFLDALPQFRIRRRRPRHCSRNSSTPKPWRTSPTTGSPATSTVTPKASCTFPAPPCSRCTGPLPSACCWKPWRCRSSTMTARSPRRLRAWSAPPKGRPLIEMGSRRTHEMAARRRGARRVPRRLLGFLQPRGAAQVWRPRAGHQRPRVHPAAHDGGWPRRAGRLPSPGRRPRRVSTTLLVDTYDITPWAWPTPSPSPARSWVPSASTPAISACWRARSANSSTNSARRTPASW